MTCVVFDDDDDEIEVPVRYAVCGTCEGRGTHVHPSIDAHGIGREDFDADPDFRDEYFGGAYDVRCNECHGARVSLEIDRDHVGADPGDIARVESHLDADHADDEEREAERRFGY